MASAIWIGALDQLDDHALDVLDLGVLLLELFKDAARLQRHFFLQLVEDRVVVLVFIRREGGDDVFDAINVLECQLPHEPVVDDESEMLPVLLLLNVLVADGEGVAHDGDEHIQQMDHNDEAGGPEDEVEQDLHSPVSESEARLVSLAHDHVAYVAERAGKGCVRDAFRLLLGQTAKIELVLRQYEEREAESEHEDNEDDEEAEDVDHDLRGDTN